MAELLPPAGVLALSWNSALRQISVPVVTSYAPGRDLGRRKKQIENGAVSSRLRAAPDMHETLMFLHDVLHH
jgi:hypothetical protein